MGSADETIRLYDRDGVLVDMMTLPPHYMEGEPVRSIVVEGRKLVEGGRADSFYGKGEFAEVDK